MADEDEEEESCSETLLWTCKECVLEPLTGLAQDIC